MFAIVDVETTGLNFHREQLTEVAVILFDGREVVQEWSSLINPGRRIPLEISRLTGITNEMVADAPIFPEIARDLVLLTEGATLVGHNVGFDYAFIREEYRRLGYVFQRKTLCTVRMSRKAFPGFRSYSLSNLCNTLDIPRTIIHRAGEDAKATLVIFQRILQNRPDLVNGSSAPVDPGLRKGILDHLPEETGIYYLHDERGDIIYIGKSNNIRQRVSSHFGNDKTTKGVTIREKVSHVSYELTGNETLALLRESAEIKSIMPVHNQRGRRKTYSYGLVMEYDKKGYMQLKIKRLRDTTDIITLFSSQAEARAHLFSLWEKHQLCQKLCGLYKSQAACFHYGIGQCRGACTGEEPAADYNLRVKTALAPYRIDERSFFIVDQGRHAEERSLILIHQGQYTGYAFVGTEVLKWPTSDLRRLITPQPSDRDAQQIIAACLNAGHYQGIIPCQDAEQESDINIKG